MMEENDDQAAAALDDAATVALGLAAAIAGDARAAAAEAALARERVETAAAAAEVLRLRREVEDLRRDAATDARIEALEARAPVPVMAAAKEVTLADVSKSFRTLAACGTKVGFTFAEREKVLHLRGVLEVLSWFVWSFRNWLAASMRPRALRSSRWIRVWAHRPTLCCLWPFRPC
jgi:hypothetical protein